MKARCIQEAEIAKAPPHIREIWDWLLMQASHQDCKVLKRGDSAFRICAETLTANAKRQKSNGAFMKNIR